MSVASHASNISGERACSARGQIDTHGSAVNAQVWALLEEAYRLFGPRPTLLERDFNLPPFEDLLDELGQVRRRIAGAPAHDQRRAA